MIDEGLHRKATFWIVMLATESYAVLQNDPPDAEKLVFLAQLQAMPATLGYASSATWRCRVGAAERLAEEIFRISDPLVARYPK